MITPRCIFSLLCVNVMSSYGTYNTTTQLYQPAAQASMAIITNRTHYGLFAYESRASFGTNNRCNWTWLLWLYLLNSFVRSFVRQSFRWNRIDECGLSLFFVLRAQHESIATNCVLCQFWFINPLRYYRYSLMHLLLFTDTVSTKLNPILDLSTNQNAWSIAQKKPSWLHWKWNRYIHSLVRFGRLFQQTHTRAHHNQHAIRIRQLEDAKKKTNVEKFTSQQWNGKMDFFFSAAFRREHIRYVYLNLLDEFMCCAFSVCKLCSG